MPKDCFRFRNFVVRQERCAMKVGTDGTLLGAWARGGERILDIGTGTGLVALMMAQRFPGARVKAIDIDREACLQAEGNVAESPFAERIAVENVALQEMGRDGFFDAIVCNPPFFNDSLKCPDAQRTMARHTSTLSYRELFAGVASLLDVGGRFSAVIPFDCRGAFETEAVIAGLFASRVAAVRTTPRKPPRRFLLEFGNCPPQGAVEQGEIVIGSPEYAGLTGEFYL